MATDYRKYVENEIATRRRQLEELETEKVKVSGEMLAYENMLQHLIDAEGDAPEAPRPIRDSATAKRAGFQMSPAWTKILRTLAARGRSFNAADMISAAEQLGTKVTIQNARSQIAHYSKPKSGILRRVQAGRYAFTPKGKELLKNEGSDASASKPSNGSGLAGSPAGGPHQAPPVGSSPTNSTPASPQADPAL